VREKLLALILFLPILTVSTSFAAEPSCALNRYSVRDGVLFRGVTPMKDTEIHEAGTQNALFWAVLSKESAGDAGVFFFAEDGICVNFLLLESVYECQGIIFSPDGERFVLERGSGVRPDLLFELYKFRGMKKEAEFAGIREQIGWIGNGRLVFTGIDEGIRDGGSFHGLGYGLRLSVVMYDAAARRTVILKEATDTENFSLLSVADDGSEAAVLEESVMSEKDWSEEGKIKRREVRIKLTQSAKKRFFPSYCPFGQNSSLVL
jgi:hypothetical protein